MPAATTGRAPSASSSMGPAAAAAAMPPPSAPLPPKRGGHSSSFNSPRNATAAASPSRRTSFNGTHNSSVYAANNGSNGSFTTTHIDAEDEDGDFMIVSMTSAASSSLADELPPSQRSSFAAVKKPDPRVDDGMYVDMADSAAANASSSLSSAQSASANGSLGIGRPRPISLLTWRWAEAARFPLPKRGIGGWKLLGPCPRAAPHRRINIDDNDGQEEGAGVASGSSHSAAAIDQRRSQILDVEGFLRRAVEKVRDKPPTSTTIWSPSIKAARERAQHEQSQRRTRARSRSLSPMPTRYHHPLPAPYRDLQREIRDEEHASARWASRMIREACDLPWLSDDDDDDDDAHSWMARGATPRHGSVRPSIDRSTRFGSTLSVASSLGGIGGAAAKHMRTTRQAAASMSSAPSALSSAAASTHDLWPDAGPSTEIPQRRKKLKRAGGPIANGKSRRSTSPPDSPHYQQASTSRLNGKRPTSSNRQVPTDAQTIGRRDLDLWNNRVEPMRHASGSVSIVPPPAPLVADREFPLSFARRGATSAAGAVKKTKMAVGSTSSASHGSNGSMAPPSSFAASSSSSRPPLRRRGSSGGSMDAQPLSWNFDSYNAQNQAARRRGSGSADEDERPARRRRHHHHKKDSSSDDDDDDDSEEVRDSRRRGQHGAGSGAAVVAQRSRGVAHALGITPSASTSRSTSSSLSSAPPPSATHSSFSSSSSVPPIPAGTRTHQHTRQAAPSIASGAPPRSRSSSIEALDDDGHSFQAAVVRRASQGGSPDGSGSFSSLNSSMNISPTRRPGQALGARSRRRRQMSSGSSASTSAEGASLLGGGFATQAAPLSSTTINSSRPATANSSMSSLTSIPSASSSQGKSLGLDRQAGKLVVAPPPARVANGSGSRSTAASASTSSGPTMQRQREEDAVMDDEDARTDRSASTAPTGTARFVPLSSYEEQRERELASSSNNPTSPRRNGMNAGTGYKWNKWKGKGDKSAPLELDDDSD